jgi:hypothetical protein
MSQTLKRASLDRYDEDKNGGFPPSRLFDGGTIASARPTRRGRRHVDRPAIATAPTRCRFWHNERRPQSDVALRNWVYSGGERRSQ